jgi:DNA repair exonuclease SbcCD ATPase subunit
MQRALVMDGEGREEIEQIHIRIGLHHGLGLVKDDDVYGDVVNAASRVVRQADADQVLITDVLLEAAAVAGFECAKMGRADLKGKDEPIDVYAVAWSESATQQLISEVEARYERKFKELKKQQDQLEEEFDKAREQWRNERRALHTEIEELEAAIVRARETARQQISDELQTELRFQIEGITRSRDLLQQGLDSARQKFEADRNNLKAQIAAMEGSFVDAMERSNNPARIATNVREQVEARLAEAKQEWQLQWDGERKRLRAEIERLQRSRGTFIPPEKREAARRAVLEKLGKLPVSSALQVPKLFDELETQFEDAKIEWETERERLKIRIKRLDADLQEAQSSIRNEILQELRAQFEAKLSDANRDRQRLEEEIQSATSELATERQRLNARIQSLEGAFPETLEAARKQALAELQSQFDLKLEEGNRTRSRMERKHQDAVEEIQAQLRDANRQLSALEEQLRQAREAPYRAQKSARRLTSSD